MTRLEEQASIIPRNKLEGEYCRLWNKSCCDDDHIKTLNSIIECLKEKIKGEK